MLWEKPCTNRQIWFNFKDTNIAHHIFWHSGGPVKYLVLWVLLNVLDLRNGWQKVSKVPKCNFRSVRAWEVTQWIRKISQFKNIWIGGVSSRRKWNVGNLFSYVNIQLSVSANSFLLFRKNIDLGEWFVYWHFMITSLFEDVPIFCW